MVALLVSVTGGLIYAEEAIPTDCRDGEYCSVEGILEKQNVGDATSPEKKNILHAVEFNNLVETLRNMRRYKSGGFAFGPQSEAKGVNGSGEDGFAFAVGMNSKANTIGSVAIGNVARAENIAAFAVGNYALASGSGSAAIGNQVKSTGTVSLALGNTTTASGQAAIASGYATKATGDFSFAGGDRSESAGAGSIALGNQAKASGISSFATGYMTQAVGKSSTAIGNQTKALADGAFAAGFGTQAKGINSIALGNVSFAEGGNSFAVGNGAKASGEVSFAFGNAAQSTGQAAVSFGTTTVASGIGSFATGMGNRAEGNFSFVSGSASKSEGNLSTAMGQNTYAAKNFGVAIGHGTFSNSESSAAMGKYNVGYEDSIFEIGIGTNDGTRKNALTVYKNGDISINGNLSICDAEGACSVINPNQDPNPNPNPNPTPGESLWEEFDQGITYKGGIVQVDSETGYHSRLNMIGHDDGRQYSILEFRAPAEVDAEQPSWIFTHSAGYQNATPGDFALVRRIGTDHRTVMNLTADGQFSIGPGTNILKPVPENLQARINGDMGAKQYCNRDGEACFTPATVTELWDKFQELPTCSEGEILQYSDDEWICAVMNEGGSSEPGDSFWVQETNGALTYTNTDDLTKITIQNGYLNVRNLDPSANDVGFYLTGTNSQWGLYSNNEKLSILPKSTMTNPEITLKSKVLIGVNPAIMTVPQSLEAVVDGNIGAEQFCNKTGSKCFTVEDILALMGE